ncbi:unnamed protein product [Peniophora sp. CBMAI 1063]|nr:unnamed protein product [Peniophora sp. CBMAI 1063]
MASNEADAPAIEHLDVAASPETPTAAARLPKLTLKPPEVPPPAPEASRVVQRQTPDSHADRSRSRSESASAEADAERLATGEGDEEEQDELDTTPPLPMPPSLSSIPPAPSLMHAHASASSTPTPPISLPAARGRGRGRPKGSLNKRKREGAASSTGTGRGGKAKAADAAVGVMNLPAPPRAPEIPPPASSDLKIRFESFAPNPPPPDAAEPPAKKRKTNKDKAPKAKAGTITIPAQAPQTGQFQASGSFTHIPPPPQIDNIPPPPVHRYVDPPPQHAGAPKLPIPPHPPAPAHHPVAPTPPKPPKQPKQPKVTKPQAIAEATPNSPPQAPSPAPTSPALTAAPLPVPGEGGPSAAELLEGVPIPRYPLPTRPFAVKPPGKLLANTWASNPPLDRTKLPARRWRLVQREIRGIAGGRWFAKSWAGGERSPLKGEGMGALGLVVEPTSGAARPSLPLPAPPAPMSFAGLPPFNGMSGSATPAFSLPPTPGVSGMPTGLAALAAAGAAAQHLAVPHENGKMEVDD